MLKGHPHRRAGRILIALAFVFGIAGAARAQIRTVSLESVGDSITCRVGKTTRKLTPDKFRIQFRATSKETQEFFEAVAPYTDLVNYLYVVPVTDTPNVEICPADGGMNYLAYNANWLLSVYQDTNSKWTLYAIIAHEVGHFARGHDRTSLGSNHNIESVADEYAGEVLAKMGATLPESLAAYNSDKIGDHRGDDTHPPLGERLKLVEKGWRTIRGKETSTEETSGPGGGGRPDPSKVAGALGNGIYVFWYVTFAYNAEGQGTVAHRDSERYKVVNKPEVGQHYVWQGRTWRVYVIEGSFVWLCNLDPDREEGAFGNNVFEFWYVSGDHREAQRYTMKERPQVGRCYSWRDRSWRIYTVTGSRVWLNACS